MPANLFRFCLGSTFDTLPTPANLHRWKMVTEPSCCLCNNKVCTIAHILGGCKTAFAQNRSTVRHDSVLSELSECITKPAKSIKVPSIRGIHQVKFVKAGKPGRWSNTQERKKSKSMPSGILHLASDWRVLVRGKVRVLAP